MKKTSTYQITGATLEPISAADEHRHLLEWKLKNNYASRDALISNYILFAVKTVRRAYPGMDEDESLMLAHSAILDALDRMDPVKHVAVRVSAFLKFSVRLCKRRQIRESEIVHGPQKERGRERRVPLDARGTGDQSSLDGFDTGIVNPDSVAPEVDLDQILHVDSFDHESHESKLDTVLECLKQLEPVFRDTLYKRFFERKTLDEVARECVPPVSKEAVRLREERALKKLRTLLAGRDVNSA